MSEPPRWKRLWLGDFNRKFALCPGYVRSQTDGQRHYITGRKLAELYGVPLSQCITLETEEQREAFRAKSDYVYLHPQYNGNYSLERAIKRATR